MQNFYTQKKKPNKFYGKKGKETSINGEINQAHGLEDSIL